MKRGSSVLQPPSDAAKRHTHPARTHVAGVADARLLSAAADAHAAGEHTPDARAAGSSPFPAATSLFSPDVSTKMASDLLIRLSEATQKAQVHPGSRVEAEPQRREALLEARGGQQDEPGLALSPDGPGASPEPPSLTHTPDGNAPTDTLASDLLRKLAERQEVNCHGVRVKEEEEPMEVDAMVAAAAAAAAAPDLARDRPAAKDMTTSSPPAAASLPLFTIKTEDQGPGAKMAEQRLLGLKLDDGFFAGGCQAGSAAAATAASEFQFRVKLEDGGAKMADQLLPGAKAEELVLYKAKLAERPFSAAKTSGRPESQVQDQVQDQDRVQDQDQDQDQGFSRAPKTEEQLFFGAKMEDQCLRAVLWQDMSVNLASTLLHQLSERVSKSNGQLLERSTPPVRSSPALKANVDPLRSSTPLLPPHETQTSLSRDQTAACSYFYRCHVCGFETEGRGLFQAHMAEHRQWERGAFSLHCCACDHSTNQEAEMRAHADTHARGDAVAGGDMRCPITSPAAAAAAAGGGGSAPAVAMATQPEKSASEHRCRICQRSFPGQQELLVHFQGHRQGNQYRCDRCGHLTRTANKLVEHVRVHTGERPFTCDLCPYSAKRRDSLRLHCKVKHAGRVHGNAAGTDAPGDVHTHRSYAHGDNQRANKHVQRLHTPPSAHPSSSSCSSSSCSSSSCSSLPLPLHPSFCDRAGWRDLSPLLPITTLISLKPRSPSSCSSSCSSSSSSSSSTKHSFLGYLGLTTSL